MKLQIGILGYHMRSVGIMIGDNGSPPRCLTFPDGIDWRSRSEEPYIIPKGIINRLSSQYSRWGQPPKSVTMAVTGYDPRFVGNRFREILKSHGDPTSHFHLSSLAEAAHRGAFMGRDGILLRCGHSSSVFTQIGPCKVITGGWSTVGGDDASGIWFGHQGICCVTKLHDKSVSSADGEFAEELLTRLSAKNPDTRSDAPTLLEDLHLKKELNGDRAWKKRLYEIGSEVVEIAASNAVGVDSALLIVERGLNHLLGLVRGGLTHAQVPYTSSFDLCLSGSLFRNAWYLTRFKQRLLDSFPNAKIIAPRYSPVMGIALLARLNDGYTSAADSESFAAAWGNESWAKAIART